MPERLLYGIAGNDDDIARDEHASPMPEHIRSFEWFSTSVGPVSGWPAALRFAVRLMLYSSAPMAVLAGREGIVIHNDAAREIFGDSYEDALGRPISEALPVASAFYRRAMAACYEGRGLRFRDQPIRLVRNGVQETAWFSFSLTPVTDEQGNIFGALLIASETSERMRALREVNASRQRMEIALDAGGIVGTWDFDVVTSNIVIEGGFARMFGISAREASEGVGLTSLMTRVHPDDREPMLQALDNALVNGSDCRCRYRAITRDGQVRWYVASGRPVRDEQGQISQLAGIIIDITAQTEASVALEQSNMRFDLLTEAIPQVVWSADAEGGHDYFNRRWTEFTGISRNDITPELWRNLVHADDRQRVRNIWRDCLANGHIYDIDYRFRYHDGTYRWVRVIGMPLCDSGGRIVRWYGTATDIDDARQMQARREIVTHELDHRIKNLFALVNGLVSLSVRDEPALRPLADRLRSRLGALHVAHGLIRNDRSVESGSLRQLLEQLLKPYETADADHIIVEGADIVIDAGALTSVALAFHELVTNSAKYGALASRDGQLRIRLARGREGCTIAWDERFPEKEAGPAYSGGFGSRLLETIVGHQLRGTFQRTFSAGELAVAIELPEAIFPSPSR